jgi:hypothetical protein
LLSGILLKVDRKRWINFPWDESIAEGKLYPISLAKKIGIDTPFYFVSNDLNEIKKSCNPDKKYIIKMLSDTALAKQHGQYMHVPNLNEYEALYTNDFDYQLILNKDIDETPMLIQEKINGDFEWRVVVVDEKIYASKLTLTGETIDSRLIDKRLESKSTLNLNIQSKILELCKKLNLRFSTFDFIECNSKYYLIDINPSGNWLWQTLEPLNLPIIDGLVQSIIENKFTA